MHMIVLSLLCSTTLVLTLGAVYINSAPRAFPATIERLAKSVNSHIHEGSIVLAFLSNLVAVPYLAIRASDRRFRNAAFTSQWKYAVATCVYGLASLSGVVLAICFM